jgi:hypothetical protein
MQLAAGLGRAEGYILIKAKALPGIGQPKHAQKCNYSALTVSTLIWPGAEESASMAACCICFCQNSLTLGVETSNSLYRQGSIVFGVSLPA